MIDHTTLMTYLAILLGFVFLPGPAVLMTVARATSAGPRTGLLTALGIAVGDVIHTVLAVVGISAIILASAVLFSVVKYLGAAYLVYLGVRAILERTQPDLAAATAAITPRAAFSQAVLIEVLNPKSAMFFLAFLPQFVVPENGAVALQLLILGLLYVAMGLMATVVVAFGAGGVGGFLRRNPAVLRWQGKVVCSIYCALGIRLALQER